VQRSPALAARKGGIGSAGAFSRLLELPDNDGIQRGVMPFGARQVEVEQFDAAGAPIANFVGQLGCRRERAIVHEPVLLAS
jgi:hypothetical protein